MSETTSDARDSRPGELLVRCPGCGGELQVDAATGEVLAHRPARAERPPSKDFDALLAGVGESKKHAESVFEREMGALKDRDRILEEKFRKALERAEEEDDGTPPPRPWDLD